MILSRFNPWALGSLVAAVMALLTWAAGWWTLPVVALVMGTMLHEAPGRAGAIAWAAVEAWAGLLLLDAAGSGFSALLALGGILRIPGPVVILVTLLFAAGLAWSAATLGTAIGSALARPRPVSA